LTVLDVRHEGERRFISDYSTPALVNGFRVAIHVPFSGESDLFKFRPSTRNYNPPIASVAKGEVQVIIEFPADSPRDVKAEAESVLGRIDNYLAWAKSDAETFNGGLAPRARAAIQTPPARPRELRTTPKHRHPDALPRGVTKDVHR